MNMTGEKVSVIVFEGAAADSPVEEMMLRVRQAALLDNLDKLRQVSSAGPVVLVTNNPALAGQARMAGAVVHENSIAPADFHFGRELQKIVLEHGFTRVLCLSGAGSPLITVEELSAICRKVLTRERFVYTNNTQSADLVAFTVTENFARAELPSMDNALATSLRDQLCLEMELMPETLGLLFDLDTPADLLVLGAGPFAGPRTRACLDTLDLDYTRLRAAKEVLSGYYQEVALLGRVGAPVMARLNAHLKLRLRVFSEERGMKALGRIEAGEVVSLMGYLLEETGFRRFFDYLSRVARCAFLDSRVLMAHHKFDFSDRERFLSDLGQWREIAHPWLRDFTRAAVECPIPVILGGHSLVAGSLWALSCELAPGSPGC